MTTVEDVLVAKGSDVVAAGPETTVREAVRRMVEANVGCLLIEEDNMIVGIVTERDMLRKVLGQGKDPAKLTLADVMSSPVQTCSPADTIRYCADILAEHRFRHLVVMDRDEPAGVVSLRAVAIELRRLLRDI